jgi:hypothetical protein
MFRSIFCLAAFSLFSTAVFGQLYVNAGVDTLRLDVRKALHFYQRYLEAFAEGAKPDYREYWSEADRRDYQVPDPVVYGINGGIATYAMGARPTIIYLKPTADYIRIKTHFSWTDTAGNVSTLAITNHYVHMNAAGKPEFISPVKIGARDWPTRTVRNVTFRYPSYHRFSPAKADSLIAKIIRLEREWSLKPVPIHLYFTDTWDEIQALRGFDFSMGAGNAEKPSGISNDTDNVIYCSGLGENYFHEVVPNLKNNYFAPCSSDKILFFGPCP